MITIVVSGGQTGADQAGWKAAQACDIPTGGWMPLHFMTEDGADSSLGRLYGAKTLPTTPEADRRPSRTRIATGE